MIALDRVLASIDKSQIMPKDVEGVKADPPAIFFSNAPAVLVNFDGEPIWSPIKGNDLKFAVNTNWDVFQHEPTKTFYLRNEQAWLKTARPHGTVDGRRQAAGELLASCRPTRTGRTSRPSLPGKALFRATGGRRCSSASSRRS